VTNDAVHPVTLCLKAWVDLAEDDHRDRGVLGEAVYGPADEGLSNVQWAHVVPEEQWAVLARVDGILVSYLAVMSRTVFADGELADVAGIRSVKTHPDYRRRGFATAAMKLAATFIAGELAPDFSLLWASTMAVPMYQALGWAVFDGEVVCEQHGTTVRCADLLAESSFMISFPSEPRRIASLDLRGLPW